MSANIVYSVQPQFTGLREGTYGLYQGGALRETYELKGRDDVIAVEFQVSGDEVDLVLVRSH